MKKYSAFIAGLALLAPVIVFAQGDLANVDTFLDNLGGLIATAIPVVLGLAVLAFFWGMAKYVMAAGDEEAKKKGRETMIWGVIAIFVAVSLWGFVSVLQGAFFAESDLAAPTETQITPGFLPTGTI